MGTYKSDPPPVPEHRARLIEIFRDAGTLMLSTRRGDGTMHLRPMAVARVTDEGHVYLATSSRTEKVAELARDSRAQLIFQSKTQYAVLDGDVTVSSDRALIHELWKESWKLWFPEGKDDPEIVILIVDAQRGEYWDQAGTKGLSFMFRAAKAYVQGKDVEIKPDDHGTVRF